MTYKGTKFFTVIPKYGIVGGDVEKNNGIGAESIYDGPFELENYTIKHFKGDVSTSLFQDKREKSHSSFAITTK